VTFRDRLIGTLRLLRPILEQPGVLVVGSEVPNLLEPDAASTLVVSQDVDIAIPVDEREAVKPYLRTLEGLVPSAEEPSVYVSPALIEVNFRGLDRRIRDASETYVLDDAELPLMVLGPLGLLRPGPVATVEDLRVPLPRVGDLIAEKLLTDRTGEKGVRDLLVVAGLLHAARDEDIEEFLARVRSLAPPSSHAISSSLTVLSLLDSRPDMPDPTPFRHLIAGLLSKIEERRE
jgi:hypothetical protein